LTHHSLQAREKFVHFSTERGGDRKFSRRSWGDNTDREFLVQTETQFIKRTFKLGLKDVEDFDESKGSTYGTQLIEMLDKSLMLRTEL
jgi:hypothetical protein